MNNENVIVFSVDDKIVDLLLVSIISLRKFNNQKIYIFSNKISEKNKNLILEEVNNVEIIEISKDLKRFEFKNQKISWKVTLSCYGWMFVGKYLDKYKKALYLDADTYIRGDLQELFNIETEKTFIAVPEIISTNSFKTTFQYDWIKNKGFNFYTHAKSLGMNMKEYNFYVNSGVILINIHRYSKKNYLEKFIDWNKENSVRLFNDQDVFNAIAKNDFLHINSNFNFTKATFGTVGSSINNSNFIKKMKNAKIIHLAGKFEKPPFKEGSLFIFKKEYMYIYKKVKKLIEK